MSRGGFGRWNVRVEYLRNIMSGLWVWGMECRVEDLGNKMSGFWVWGQGDVPIPPPKHLMVGFPGLRGFTVLD